MRAKALMGANIKFLQQVIAKESKGKHVTKNDFMIIKSMTKVNKKKKHICYKNLSINDCEENHILDC